MRKESKINPPWSVKAVIAFQSVMWGISGLYLIRFALLQPTFPEAYSLAALIYLGLSTLILIGIWKKNKVALFFMALIAILGLISSPIGTIEGLVVIGLLLTKDTRSYFGLIKKGGENNG